MRRGRGGVEPSFWLRFIDDILVVWPGLGEGFSDFLAELNSFHPNLEYTSEESITSINFLDLRIYKGTRFRERGVFDLGPYFKKTNMFQYLHNHSCHPRHTNKDLIKGGSHQNATSQQRFLNLCQILKKNRRSAAGPRLPERVGKSHFWDLAIWDEAGNAQP